MHYHFLYPPPPLDEVIEFLWLYHGYQPPHTLERVLPAGTMELVVNLQDGELRVNDRDDVTRMERFRGPLLSGVHRRHFVIDTRQQYSIMGAHLKPGGAWRLFGVPGGELADRHLGLADLLGRTADECMEAIWDAPDHSARLLVLHRFLRQRRLRGGHAGIRWAVDQFCAYPDRLGVRALSDEVGLSSRRFNELFVREVGLSPKTFGRIRRFQTMLKRAFAERRSDWCALAVEMGYADQAHLIRDFREFTGLTPVAYQTLCGAEMNHVPLEERRHICPMAGG